VAGSRARWRDRSPGAKDAAAYRGLALGEETQTEGKTQMIILPPAVMTTRIRVGHTWYEAGTEVAIVQAAIDHMAMQLEEVRKALARSRAVVGRDY